MWPASNFTLQLTTSSRCWPVAAERERSATGESHDGLSVTARACVRATWLMGWLSVRCSSSCRCSPATRSSGEVGVRVIAHARCDSSRPRPRETYGHEGWIASLDGSPARTSAYCW